MIKEGQVRIPSGCAIAAVISKEGKKMSGEIPDRRPETELVSAVVHEEGIHRTTVGRYAEPLATGKQPTGKKNELIYSRYGTNNNLHPVCVSGHLHPTEQG